MKKNLKRTVLLLAGLFFMSTAANAQFNIGSKIKGAVKSSVKKTTDKVKNAPKEIMGKAEAAVEKAVNQTISDAETKANSFVTDKATEAKNNALNNRTYKPSKKALKNDPQAADNTTPNGHTRTVAQIHAGYEHLPSAYASPYYENSNWYRMDTKESNKFHNTMRGKVFQEAYKFRDNGSIGQWIYAYGDSGDAVPAGYHTMWANMARFAADPKGVVPVAYFINTKVMLYMYTLGGLKMGKSSTNKMVSTEIYLIDTPENLIYALSNEVNRLEGILYSVTPYSVLFEATENMMNGIDNNLSSYPVNAAAYYDCAEQGMEYLAHHPKNPKDDAYEQLTRKWNKYKVQRTSIMQGAKAAAYGKQAMPATLKVDASTENAVLAAVKKQMPSLNAQKVVFFDKDWTNAKSDEWPYKIVSRSKLIGVLYKKGDDWVLEKFDWIQDTSNNGKSWSKTYRFISQGGPRLVDYK